MVVNRSRLNLICLRWSETHNSIGSEHNTKARIMEAEDLRSFALIDIISVTLPGKLSCQYRWQISLRPERRHTCNFLSGPEESSEGRRSIESLIW